MPSQAKVAFEQLQRGKVGEGRAKVTQWQVPTPAKPATNGVRHVPLLNHFVIFCHCVDSSRP